MTSSIVLKNILDHESCELKQMIDAFMGEKMAEFQQTMKQNVDKIVTERISEFYSPLEPRSEEVLFDKPVPEYIISSAIQNEVRLNNHSSKILEIKELNNKKCFEFESRLPYSNCFGIVWILKKGFIYSAFSGPSGFYYIQHTIPTHVLFAIKFVGIVQVNNQGGPPLQHLQRFYSTNPQYFQPNCVEFEEICQREHAEIKKQKEELEELTHQSNEIMEEAHRIIDENVEKKEYYESLDRRLQQIVLDEEKIREEKQKMLFVKERLLEMKAEIEKERQELEKEKQKFISQKNKSIDIDKCFEDLL